MTTDKSETKDALWKDLKLCNGVISNETLVQMKSRKVQAKERINEIQEALKLDKTDWNTPRSGPPGSHLTKAGASPNPSDKILIEKVLGTVLDMKRVMNEEFMTITQKINSLDEKMKSCTCNCTMEKSS